MAAHCPPSQWTSACGQLATISESTVPTRPASRPRCASCQHPSLKARHSGLCLRNRTARRHTHCTLPTAAHRGRAPHINLNISMFGMLTGCDFAETAIHPVSIYAALSPPCPEQRAKSFRKLAECSQPPLRAARLLPSVIKPRMRRVPLATVGPAGPPTRRAGTNAAPRRS